MHRIKLDKIPKHLIEYDSGTENLFCRMLMELMLQGFEIDFDSIKISPMALQDLKQSIRQQLNCKY